MQLARGGRGQRRSSYFGRLLYSEVRWEDRTFIRFNFVFVFCWCFCAAGHQYFPGVSESEYQLIDPFPSRIYHKFDGVRRSIIKTHSTQITTTAAAAATAAGIKTTINIQHVLQQQQQH